MNQKNGSPEQRRATLFAKTPATAISLCPFKGAEVAIVPVRYALDRSRYDVDCQTLKPLPASGVWADLPTLRSRTYTLRQLYDGYLYVYDETAGTFHEYAVSASDSTLARIVWTDAQVGNDQRSGAADPKPFLLYPRMNRLHLGFSPRQWTWGLCEHMRSNADSRARWMQPLDLAAYCTTMAEPGTLPLSRIAEAVADVDRENVKQDGRFDDSSVPTTNGNAEAAYSAAGCAPAGADVYWLGSVPDKDSALLVALDDPLAMLTDLGLQLAADQAALRAWQDEHGHKAGTAKTVTNLCASSDNPDNLPAAVSNDVVLTQRYLGEVDACLERRLTEESEQLASSLRGDALMTPVSLQSREMKEALQARYGTILSDQDYTFWEQRAKWRREIDLEGARAYIARHQPAGDLLTQAVRDSQADLIQWADYIGVDPGVVFIDTANPGSLLYLQSIMSELLIILAQDAHTHEWLLEQEETATSLFGTMRYGFSAGLKDALHQDADRLLNGLNDYTNLATRAGELNSVLNHPSVADSAWMRLLKQAVRETFSALSELAAGEGKGIAETILMAWLPMDSRRVKGAHQNLTALIRTLMIGRVLSNSPQRLAIDAEVGNRLKTWKRENRVLDHKIRGLQRSWQYPTTGGYDRRSLTRQLQQLTETLQLHYLKIPALLDFQDRQYAQLISNEVRTFLQSGQPFERWQATAKNWIGRQKMDGATGITWGVIMFNLINTAFLYADLTRDGDFSERDIIKVGYGLAYTANLLMGVYVAAPWAVIQAAQPLVAGSKTVTILERSSSYWAARGNPVWAEAIRGFRAGMVAMGAFGVLGAVLELVDLRQDIKDAQTPHEKTLLWVKSGTVLLMGVGALAYLTAGILPKAIAAAVMSVWMLGVLSAIGVIYLFSTMLLNHLKQDSVGLWLRRCCWSISNGSRYPDTPEGAAEEQRHFLKIALSPTVLVKQTFQYENLLVINRGIVPIPAQNGAWIQILLPHNLRGRSIELNIISSERPLSFMPVEKSSANLDTYFLDYGQFRSTASFGSVTNERPPRNPNDLCFPPTPPEEDIVWQTWVPLEKQAGFVELQIWFPKDLVVPDSEDAGYLYQIESSRDAEITVDGLLPVQLEVKALPRTGSMKLEVPA